jgi:hypothetical protein
VQEPTQASARGTRRWSVAAAFAGGRRAPGGSGAAARSFRRGSLFRGVRAIGAGPPRGGVACLSGERLPRSRLPPLPFERALDRPSPSRRRRPRRTAALPLLVGQSGRSAGLHRRAAARRRFEGYAGSPRLGKTNRDRLLRRTCAVFSLTDVVHLFVYEFPCCGGGALADSKIALRLLDGALGWHGGKLNLARARTRVPPAHRPHCRAWMPSKRSQVAHST